MVLINSTRGSPTHSDKLNHFCRTESLSICFTCTMHDRNNLLSCTFNTDPPHDILSMISKTHLAMMWL